MTSYDHVQGWKASIYFEGLILRKMDKKAKEKRTVTILYDTYGGIDKGHLTKTWMSGSQRSFLETVTLR